MHVNREPRGSLPTSFSMGTPTYVCTISLDGSHRKIPDPFVHFKASSFKNCEKVKKRKKENKTPLPTDSASLGKIEDSSIFYPSICSPIQIFGVLAD